MKKLFVLMTLAVMMASSALAGIDMVLDPATPVNVPKGGSTDVVLTVLVDGVPTAGIPVTLDSFCREQVDPTYRCNAGDIYTPSEVGVALSDVTTDANGEVVVTLTHDGSDDMGSYHYTVCEGASGTCVEEAAEVTGDFLIPEFTTIGAGLVLLGAGLYAYKKRN